MVEKDQMQDEETLGPPKLLRAGVSRTTFIAFLFSAMMAISGLTFINADQTYVMVDILDYPRTLVGNAVGNLALADELTAMVMVSVWGALSDRMARRWLFSLGFLLMGLATMLYPWSTTVFPASVTAFFRSMLAFRLLFALGASAATAMLTALIGDYSGEKSRAKVAGITGFSTGIGALFAALVLSRLPTYFLRDSKIVPGGLRDIPNGGATLVISFAIAGGLLVLTAIIAASFLATPPDLRIDQRMPLIKRISVGIFAASHPFVALAYASGFVARADSIALMLFIPPWVDNYMTAAGLCPPNPDVLTRCQPAKRLASNLMSVAHTTMLLGAPIFGILCDRMGPVPAVVVPSGCGLLAYGLLYFMPDPMNKMVYLALALAGFATIGMIISSMALIAAVSSPQHRGALSGVYSFFGALGIIVTSKVGGYLLDPLRGTTSFIVVAVSSGVVFFASLSITSYRKKIRPLGISSAHQ